jgi:putative amino-acid transport system permease protein
MDFFKIIDSLLSVDKGHMEAVSSYKFFEAYLAVALVYCLMVIVFCYLQKRIDNKMNEAY